MKGNTSMSATIPLPVRAELQRQALFAAWIAQRSIPTQAGGAAAVLAACRRVLRDAWADWRERRRILATRRTLMNLDDATLRDIGFVRAEIESVAAEAHGGVAATRARLLGHGGPIGH
jgi:uncharacterized protein YjiS (DUF1127 family)